MKPRTSDRADFDSAQLFGRNSQAWLAAIVESSDDAIIGKTLDSVVRSWNHGATVMFGYTPEEMIGRSILELIPADRHHEETEIVSRLARGERVDHFETVRLRKDGSTLDVSLSVSPIRDANGQIIGAAKIARDISEAKRLHRAERELTEQVQNTAAELEQQLEEGQSLQEELEHVNDELLRSLGETQGAREEADAARHQAEEANAAKSAFLATMSHELRTPLNAIAGYVDLLELELHGPLTANQREDVSRLRRSSESLRRLIEDILSFAKLESGRVDYRYELVRFNALLEGLEPFIAPRLQKKGLMYQLVTCQPELTAEADRDKVEQILLNLLTNAIKFTDAGGVEVRCSAGDERIHIHVIDTGCGIRAAVQERIFEPFVQGDRSLTRTVEGTGLGLSISRQLARGMSGDVTLASEVGKGSTFTLTLPRVQRSGHSNH